MKNKLILFCITSHRPLHSALNKQDKLWRHSNGQIYNNHNY